MGTIALTAIRVAVRIETSLTEAPLQTGALDQLGRAFKPSIASVAIRKN